MPYALSCSSRSRRLWLLPAIQYSQPYLGRENVDYDEVEKVAGNEVMELQSTVAETSWVSTGIGAVVSRSSSRRSVKTK